MMFLSIGENRLSRERRVIASSKITRRFQVTITKEVRERFNLKEGDLILFVVEGDRLLIEKG
jgi:AbrB family looped-hinge helix DNA binding protein